jgi:hypothetical protein
MSPIFSLSPRERAGVREQRLFDFDTSRLEAEFPLPLPLPRGGRGVTP